MSCCGLCKTTLCAEWTFGLPTFKGQTFKGRTFAGQTFEGQTFKGQIFEGQTFERQALDGQAFEGQAFEGQTFKGQTSAAQTFDRQNLKRKPDPEHHPNKKKLQNSWDFRVLFGSTELRLWYNTGVPAGDEFPLNSTPTETENVSLG